MRPPTNWNKDRILAFLRRECPNAPFADCMSLASDFQNIFDSEITAHEMLAVLSEKVLGFDHNSYPPKKLIEKFKDDKVVLMAIREVQNAQGQVLICSIDSMEQLYERVGKKVDEKEIDCLLRCVKK